MREAQHNAPATRMEMLRTSMPPEDVVCLQKFKSQIEKFLQIARALGFFEHSPDSKGAGYDMPRYALLPEGALASLVSGDTITDDPESVAQWTEQGNSDPERFITSLIEESERLGIRHTERTGSIGVLGIKPALSALKEKVTTARDVASLHGILAMCPPPAEELPPWFQVMVRHQLMPSDIEQLLTQSVTPDDLSGQTGEIHGGMTALIH